MKRINHLYIHVPFCKSICTYCNFTKVIYREDSVKQYLKRIIKDIEKLENKFKTIYIGGGTPNCLSDNELEQLLSVVSKKLLDDTEFTIELNPEFITESQLDIFKKYNINRFSLGVQILNDTILKKINRTHNKDNVCNAINLMQKKGFKNISCDFIINLPLMKNKDIDNIISFIKKYEIKHVSAYTLEIKENSILEKINYKIDEEKEEILLNYFIEQMKLKTNLKQYEVSNWSTSEKYYSKHNLSYWNLDEWIGIGWGATSYCNQTIIENIGNYNSWNKKQIRENKAQYFLTILMMGLRKANGINLSIKRNLEAFEFYKDKLDKKLYVIKNNRLKCKNILLLNNLLYSLI